MLDKEARRAARASKRAARKERNERRQLSPSITGVIVFLLIWLGTGHFIIGVIVGGLVADLEDGRREQRAAHRKLEEDIGVFRGSAT